MKTIKQLTIVILALMAAGMGSTLGAQTTKETEIQKKEAERLQRESEKSSEQVQKALKLHEEELRKALEETKRAQKDEWQKLSEDQIRKQQGYIENYRRNRERWEEQNQRQSRAFHYVMPPDQYRLFDGKEFLSTEPFKMIQDFEGIVVMSDATTLDISKDLEEVDYENDFSYEVPIDSRSLSVMIRGDLDDGLLRFSLIRPGGKVSQDFEITPLASMQWNQTLRWDEEDADQFAGKWIIRIKADNATGHYRATVRNN